MGVHFDVFLSYNTDDRAEVVALNKLLKEQLGFRTWLDEEQVLAGEPFLLRVQEGLTHSRSCALFIGRSGIGPWENREFYAALSMQVAEPHYRVIPVLLTTASKTPVLPPLLASNSWVDLRTNPIEGASRLIAGIRGAQRATFQPAPLVYRVGDTRHEHGLPSAFSADVQKIVELLVGDSLYARQDVFVRELIQNAADACARRRADTFGYFPEIHVRINTAEGFLEVEDNGDGMTAARLTDDFSVIGRSIRDEPDILRRTTSDRNDRLFLVAKFGIGFISTFMVAKKVVVSTTSEGYEQISFTITGISEPFLYSVQSDCDRDRSAIGTTVRVYLNPDFLEGQRKLDLVGAVRVHLKHPSFVDLTVDGRGEALEDRWNVEKCTVTKSARLAGSYEARFGITKPRTGPPRPFGAKRYFGESLETDNEFGISSGGFFVTNNPEKLFPDGLPMWIVGEINFWPGSIDLNMARDGVISNDRLSSVRQHMTESIRNLIFEYATACRAGKHPADERILSFAFFCYDRALKEKKDKTTTDYIEQLLTLEEARELILDGLLVGGSGSSGERNRDTLRSAIQLAKQVGQNMAYAYWSNTRYPAMDLVIKGLQAHGVLVFEYFEHELAFYGANTGLRRKVSEWSVLSDILQSDGMALKWLDRTKPKEIEVLFCQEKGVPEEVRSEFSRAMVGESVVFVEIPGAELAFSVDGCVYVNAANVAFLELLRQLSTLERSMLRAYVLGVAQRSLDGL